MAPGRQGSGLETKGFGGSCPTAASTNLQPRRNGASDRRTGTPHSTSPAVALGGAGMATEGSNRDGGRGDVVKSPAHIPSWLGRGLARVQSHLSGGSGAAG